MDAISLLTLQHYWWAIISLLGSLLVFLMFVQGGQTLIYKIGRTDKQRTMIINTLGRKWEFTFTTLVTFGGAFFASFPLFYASSFGGAYWVWIIILFCFIIQAVSYEFRSKPENFLGKRTFETFLLINGLLGTTLIGVAVGTFFNGSMFSLNEYNQVTWQTNWRGLEALLSISNISLGLAVFFLSRTLGLFYFLNTIDEDEIVMRSKKMIYRNAIPFLVFFLYFLVSIILKDGYAYNAETLVVSIEPYKYLHNFIQMPVVLILFLIGVVLVLYSVFVALYRKASNAIWYGGVGTILTVFALFLLVGYNNTCFYPSSFDIQSSLTIQNSSSSKFTLAAMSYVSLMIPFVVAYIWYAWKSMNNSKIDKDEMNEDIHIY